MHNQQKEEPYFEVRRWSLTHFQGPFEPYPENDEFITLVKAAQYILETVIPKTKEYNITSLELTGRSGEGGIDSDWLINYDEYPQISAQRNQDRINERRDLINLVCRQARDADLEMYLWDHEPYFPAEFYEAVPEARGVDYPVCLSHEQSMRFIEAKYIELFTKMPDINGLVLSMNECGGINILTDIGCQCERCRNIPICDKIRSLLDHLLAVCNQYGKKLVVRTFTAARYRELGKHTETELLKQAFANLPEEITLMSKYCPADFYYLSGNHDPLIGAFKNKHIVEFTLVREWFGNTHVPLPTPRDLIDRFANMKVKGCIGAVARISNHNVLEQPVPIFQHVNEFNVFAFAKLLHSPGITLDELWKLWSARRYPQIESNKIRDIFEPAEQAAAKVFNTLGHMVVNYVGAIPNYWDTERHAWCLSRGKWEQHEIPVSRQLMNPDQAVYDEAMLEKDQAVLLLQQCQEALVRVKEQLDEMAYLELNHSFNKFKDSAEYYKFITGCYLLSVHNKDISPSLYQQAVETLKFVPQYRKKYGKAAWPSVPICNRGVSGEQFVLQCFRKHLYEFIGAPEPFEIKWHLVDDVCKVGKVPENSVEKLLMILYKLDSIPQMEDGIYGIINLKEVSLHIHNDYMVLQKADEALHIPLPVSSGCEISLIPGTYKYERQPGGYSFQLIDHE